MLTVRNLTKQYPDRQVLHPISFQVDRGDFIAVIGGSGSGKTTLLRCLALREKWTGGQYIIDGKDVLDSNMLEQFKLRRSMAFLEEVPGIDPNRTALKNVLAGVKHQLSLWRQVTGIIPTGEHVTAMDALDQVGLLEQADRPTGKLSGGEKQRVAIAKSLVQGARVILADEPVTGLDPESAHRVMADFRHLCKTRQLIVICTLNNVELAEKHTTRLWGLSEGRIVVDVSGRRLTQREKIQILG